MESILSPNSSDEYCLLFCIYPSSMIMDVSKLGLVLCYDDDLPSLMNRLHQQLKYFVVNKISTDSLWRNTRVSAHQLASV